MVPLDHFIIPNNDYMIRVCKTIYLQRKLCGDIDNREISIPMINAVDGKVLRIFNYTIPEVDSDSD